MKNKIVNSYFKSDKRETTEQMKGRWKHDNMVVHRITMK